MAAAGRCTATLCLCGGSLFLFLFEERQKQKRKDIVAGLKIPAQDTSNTRPLGEAQGNELQPLLGILDFILTNVVFFLFAYLSGSLFHLDMKGIGTSRPTGEAQGNELQPTWVFLISF